MTQRWDLSRPSGSPHPAFIQEVVASLTDPERVRQALGVDIATGEIVRRGVQQGLTADAAREELVCKLGGAVALGFAPDE